MATRVVYIPDVEIIAAFRMSMLTAEREGFPRTAAQVRGYIDALTEGRESGTEIIIVSGMKG